MSTVSSETIAVGGAVIAVPIPAKNPGKEVIQTMLWLKACPRCKGDLYWKDDMYGSYIACLQCSRYVPEAEQEKFMRPVNGPATRSRRLALSTRTAA